MEAEIEKKKESRKQNSKSSEMISQLETISLNCYRSFTENQVREKFELHLGWSFL